MGPLSSLTVLVSFLSLTSIKLTRGYSEKAYVCMLGDMYVWLVKWDAGSGQRPVEGLLLFNMAVIMVQLGF